MALDESVANRGELERYRSWLRSLAEELHGLFLLVDSSGVLIDAVVHGELQRRLGGRGLLVGATVQQLVPPLGSMLEQSVTLCHHTAISQKSEAVIEDEHGILFIKILVVKFKHNLYSVMITDSHHERTLALQVETLSADQRQTIQLLHELDARYRTLFDSLSEGVVFVARDGQILTANESAAQILRTSVAELCRLRIDGPLPFRTIGEDLQPLPIEQWPLSTTLRGGQSRQEVVVGLVFPSSSPVWLAVNARPLWRSAESLPYAAVVSFFDITLRKHLESELHHRAFHDPLTSLPNRSLFVDRLDTAIRQARRTGDLVAVFFLDLDGFKAVNDERGHDVGDRFLQGVAERLSESLRDGDTVARFGGDEFTILLPAIQIPEDALRVAERVIDELQKSMLIDGQPLIAKASLGISLYPHDGSESATLIRHADMAMYRVKSGGHHNCQFFREEINLATSRQLGRESLLGCEVQTGQLSLRYRPQVLLATEQVVAWEAELLRSSRDGQPAEPLGEALLEEGLLQQQLFCLIEQACREFCAVLPTQPAERTLVLRIDQRQLLGGSAQASLTAALERSGLLPERLELDLAVSSSLVDGAVLLEQVWQLHRLGVRLSLSASATASLPIEHLPILPVTALTLPERLWRSGLDERRMAGLCVGLTGLASQLGLPVTAIGVQSQRERDQVLQLGCQRGQGALWPPLDHLPTG